MAPSRDLVRRAGRSRLRRKTGVIERLYTAPAGGQCRHRPRRDGAGVGQERPGTATRPRRAAPVAVPSALPPDAVPTAPTGRHGRGSNAERAKQEIDSGRRGKGYIFGAFHPATGAALTPPYPAAAPPTGSTSGAGRDGIAAEVERVDALVDQPERPPGGRVLLFALAFRGGSSSSSRRTRRT